MTDGVSQPHLAEAYDRGPVRRGIHPKQYILSNGKRSNDILHSSDVASAASGAWRHEKEVHLLLHPSTLLVACTMLLSRRDEKSFSTTPTQSWTAHRVDIRQAATFSHIRTTYRQ